MKICSYKTKEIVITYDGFRDIFLNSHSMGLGGAAGSSHLEPSSILQPSAFSSLDEAGRLCLEGKREVIKWRMESNTFFFTSFLFGGITLPFFLVFSFGSALSLTTPPSSPGFSFAMPIISFPPHFFLGIKYWEEYRM